MISGLDELIKMLSSKQLDSLKPEEFLKRAELLLNDAKSSIKVENGKAKPNQLQYLLSIIADHKKQKEDTLEKVRAAALSAHQRQAIVE